MKKLILLSLILITAIVACRKDQEDTDVNVIYPPGPYVLVKTSIGGHIVDENGGTVADAVVRLGDKTTKTDAKGVFNFRDITVNAKGAYIKVEHPNYFHGSRTINVSSGTRNTVKIQLLSNVATKFVSAASGGLADYTDYSVALPAGGISTATGAPYSGQVGVAAKWLNPVSAGFGEQMPGRLEGITTDNQRSGMVSLGMLAVELKDAAGNKLKISDGYEAALRMKVPAQMLSTAPATIPLWYFDEAEGIWVEEGQATLNNGFYEGKVKHFSFWNHDYKDPLVEIQFNVVDQNGNPVEGAKVHTQLPSSGLYGFGYTDNTGTIYGLVPQNQVLDAKIFPPNLNCTTPVLTQQIGPFAQNGAYTFTINLSSVLTYTISGDLLDCNSAPVTNGYVQIDGQNDVFWADNSGHFDITLISCTPLTTVTLTGYDLTALKISTPLPLDVSSGSANAGAVTVCDALQSYLTYAFGGQIYTNPNPLIQPLDSLPIGVVDQILITTGQPSTLSIYLYLDDVTGVGTYNPQYVSAEGTINGNQIYHGCDLCPGMTVNITEYNGLGGIISGTYSGTISDFGSGQQPPPPVAISGSFRGTLK